jgi:hypothetical protein
MTALVGEIHIANGQIGIGTLLVQRYNSGIWMEVSDEVVLEKISGLFRMRRVGSWGKQR